jgi:pilus assembly protein Flp/PilA
MWREDSPGDSPESSWTHLLSLDQKRFVMLSRISRSVVDFLNREDGPTAVEYAVMLALIIVVCIVAITALGTNANATFTTVGTAIGSTAS